MGWLVHLPGEGKRQRRAWADTDPFDIKIWNGTDTGADPYHKAKNTIAGGNIQVHTK